MNIYATINGEPLYADLSGNENISCSFTNPYQSFWKATDAFSYSFDVVMTETNLKVFTADTLMLVTDFHNWTAAGELCGNAVALDRFVPQILEKDFLTKKMKVSLTRQATADTVQATASGEIYYGNERTYPGFPQNPHTGARLPLNLSTAADIEFQNRLSLKLGGRTISTVLKSIRDSDVVSWEPVYSCWQGHIGQTNGVPALSCLRPIIKQSNGTKLTNWDDPWNRRGTRLFHLMVNLTDLLEMMFGSVPEKFADDRRVVFIPFDVRKFKLQGKFTVTYTGNLISNVVYTPRHFPLCASTFAPEDESGRVDKFVGSRFATKFPFTVSKNDVRSNTAELSSSHRLYIENPTNPNLDYNVAPFLDLDKGQCLAQMNSTTNLTLEFDVNEEVSLVGDYEDKPVDGQPHPEMQDITAFSFMFINAGTIINAVWDELSEQLSLLSFDNPLNTPYRNEIQQVEAENLLSCRMKRNYDTSKTKPKKFRICTGQSFYSFRRTEGDEVVIRVNDTDVVYNGTTTSGHMPGLFAWRQLCRPEKKRGDDEVVDKYDRYTNNTELLRKYGTPSDSDVLTDGARVYYEEETGEHGILLARQTTAEERGLDAYAAAYRACGTDTMRYISNYIQPTGDEYEIECVGWDGCSDLLIGQGSGALVLRVEKAVTSDFRKWKLTCLK